MVRVLTGISILWFLIPGYAFAIGISFVVPKLYTAIAFDAGGVASVSYTHLDVYKRQASPSPSLLRNATSPEGRGFDNPHKVSGFAKGSPFGGAVEHMRD